MPWYVLHTKPRNEKKVAKLLEMKGIVAYCPIQEEIRQWSDRKKKIMEPVFRSYLFVHLKNYSEESKPVLETPGVINFLWWNKKPGVVREEEIKAIRDFLNAYKDVRTISSIALGEAVIINEGPLKNLEGTVVKLKGNKATLTISTLGISLQATVAVQALDKLQ